MSAPTGRVRGLAPWSPQRPTQELLDQIQTVLDEYRQLLPLTIRQIFYRLVGAHGYDKTEAAYARLCEHLNRARRASLIPFDAIRDDGITLAEPVAWDDADQLVRSFIQAAQHFRLDRQYGQPRRLLLAVEAAGMVPQVERVAAPYGIPVDSSGGSASLTAKNALAKKLGCWPQTEVLHIGDHDPAGGHLFTSMAEDVTALAHDFGLLADMEFTRLAVTPAQVATYSLPTAPPKPTDRRAFAGETVQAEALPPDILAEIVRAAIEDRLDQDVYQAVLAAETNASRQLSERLQPLLRDMDSAP